MSNGLNDKHSGFSQIAKCHISGSCARANRSVCESNNGWPAKAAAATAEAAEDADSEGRFRVRYGVDKDED